MVTALVIVASLLSFAFGESVNRFFLVERVFLMPFVLKYSEEIGITEEQLEKIKAYIRENEKKIERNKVILSFLSRKAKIMMLEGEEERRIRKILSDIAYLKLEMSMMNARCVRFLRATLTDEQFRKLREIITIRLFELQQ